MSEWIVRRLAQAELMPCLVPQASILEGAASALPNNCSPLTLRPCSYGRAYWRGRADQELP